MVKIFVIENFKDVTPDPTIRWFPHMIHFFKELHECISKCKHHKKTQNEK